MRTSEIHRRWLDFFAKKDHEIVPSTSLVSSDPSILFTIAGMVPLHPVHRSRDREGPVFARGERPEVHPDQRHRERRPHHAPRHLLPDGRELLLRRLLQDRRDRLLLGVPHQPPGPGRARLRPGAALVHLWEQDEESYRHVTEVIGLDPQRVVQLPREEIFWDTGQPGRRPLRRVALRPRRRVRPRRHHRHRPPMAGRREGRGPLHRDLRISSSTSTCAVRARARTTPCSANSTRNPSTPASGWSASPICSRVSTTCTRSTRSSRSSRRPRSSPVASTAPTARTTCICASSATTCAARSMLVADGVRPGNEGRGYVLRRLIRRAVRSMRLLGYTEPSMPALLPISQSMMVDSYPGLEGGLRSHQRDRLRRGGGVPPHPRDRDHPASTASPQR